MEQMKDKKEKEPIEERQERIFEEEIELNDEEEEENEAEEEMIINVDEKTLAKRRKERKAREMKIIAYETEIEKKRTEPITIVMSNNLIQKFNMMKTKLLIIIFLVDSCFMLSVYLTNINLSLIFTEVRMQLMNLSNNYC